MIFSSYDTLDADDLALLRQVLEDVCQEKALDLDAAATQEIARSLVDWYLFGVKDPADLKKMLDPIDPAGAQEN